MTSVARSVDDIRAAGTATERELVWLCDLAKTLAACAMSTVAITPAEAERLLSARPMLDSSHLEHWSHD
jgi:tRNA(Arg) A34 adenosine deaminase TadA